MTDDNMPEPVAWRYKDARSNFRYRGVAPGFDKDYPTLYPEPLYSSDQLRAAIAAERERNPWRMVMDDALVTAHLGVATDDPYDDLNLLLDWHHDIWLDPAVSSDAQALIDRGAAASEAELSTLRQQLAEAVREREALRAALDCLRLVVGDEEMFCKAAHHAKADRHDAFEPCPIHARAVDAIDAARSGNWK